MEIANRLTEEIARYLDLSVAKTKLTAANMANLDTPGYKTLGMDFGSEIEQAMAGVDAGTASRPVRIERVDGLITRPDGNNVSMDRESLNLAEAQLQFKTGVALLRQEYQRIMDAIHADK